MVNAWKVTMKQNDISTRTEPQTPAGNAAGAETGTCAGKKEWTKPEITSFAPLSEAAGISYRPGDGLSNASS